jgi:hypothetical protein
MIYTDEKIFIRVPKRRPMVKIFFKSFLKPYIIAKLSASDPLNSFNTE